MEELEVIDRTGLHGGEYRIIRIENCDQMGDMIRSWALTHGGVPAIVRNLVECANRSDRFEISRDVRLAIAKIREEYELEQMAREMRMNILEDRRYGSRVHPSGCCCHRCVARDPRPDPSLPIYAREIALLDIRVHNLERKNETDPIIARAARFGVRRGMRNRSPNQTL